MATQVIMPRQGQSVETCIITKWFKNKGDKVEQGELLFSYETDKAAFEEEAKAEGILLDVYYQEGDEVPVLKAVAIIGQAGEKLSPETMPSLSPVAEKQEQKKPELTVKIPEQDGKIEKQSRIRISPRARKVAADLGLQIENIQGTGPNGRIIERDVRAASQHQKQTSAEKIAVPAPSVVPSWNYTFEEPYVTHKLSNIRKLIATSMQASLQNSAQLTHHTSADARRMLAFREKIKSAGTNGKANITLNDMVCYAVVRALKKMPHVNAHFLGDSIRQFTKVHLGIAVDTERGLMVPTLRNADDYTLSAFSGKLKELADQCKKGNIAPELLSSTSATITVSNLGSFGIELFTPVLNIPQICILGVNTITYRPADLGGGVIGFIPVMGLSLTYDHRALDGAPASAFLKEIRTQIENIEIIHE